MYYTVYKITNLVNNKVYVGVHKTNDLDDGYMGSGKILIRAQAKYGMENFHKEILAIFDNAEAMFNMESEIVNAEFVESGDTYNLKEGGSGGFDHINSTRSVECRRKCITPQMADASHKALSKLRQDEEWCNQQAQRIRDGIAASNNKSSGFLNKTHTEAAKLAMGAKNSVHQRGTGNSQYGTCWIYSEELKQNKKIKKTELDSWLANGWLKGRKKF